MQLCILLPGGVCAWTTYLRVHTHSPSKMKLEHSHILRFVLVFVRVLCSSGRDLYMEHTFQIGAISLIGNSICTGHAKDLFHGYEPKGTLDNLFDWRSNLDRPVRMKTNVPDPSLEVTTLDFEGSPVLSRFACRHHCGNLDLVSMETHICLDCEGHQALVSVETCVWTGEGHLDLVLSMETHICLNWGKSSGLGFLPLTSTRARAHTRSANPGIYLYLYYGV